MSDIVLETLLHLFRRRKSLLRRRKNDPDFQGSFAANELYWDEYVIEKYLGKVDISELTDHLHQLNNDLKK